MKKNAIFAMSAAALLVGLVGCDTNDRNDDYNRRTNRDASMGGTATGTGQGGERGYGVPDARSGTNSGTYDNRGNYDNRGTNNTGGSGTRPRNTMEPGMGVVDEKAKDGCCAGSCGASCDKSHKQN